MMLGDGRNDFGNDADALGVAGLRVVAGLLGVLEVHDAGFEGEEGIILSATDIVSGQDLGSALADYDLSGFHELTMVPLNTQSLGG